VFWSFLFNLASCLWQNSTRNLQNFGVSLKHKILLRIFGLWPRSAMGRSQKFQVLRKLCLGSKVKSSLFLLLTRYSSLNLLFRENANLD
jgi:hypothetical protein